MNLKEAFRFQKKIQSFLRGVDNILEDESVITEVEETYLFSRVDSSIEDRKSTRASESEYADAKSVNKMMYFALFLLDERDKLTYAIKKAKADLDFDIDGEVSINKDRRSYIEKLRKMVDLKTKEHISRNGGTGYKFNTDGEQVSYKCDVKKVVSINYDRNLARKFFKRLNTEADEVSAKIDKLMIETEVNYKPPFDVYSSFDDVFYGFTPKT